MSLRPPAVLLLSALQGTESRAFSWIQIGLLALAVLVLLAALGGTWMLYRRLKEREDELDRSERRYRRIFRDSQDVIYLSRPDGSIEEMNPAGLRLLGYTREELAELNAVDLYADPADRARFVRRIREEGQVSSFEVRLRRKDGEVLDCLLTSTARVEEGEVVGYQGIIRDITDRKVFEHQLQHRAFHDALTGLPNRSLFWDRVERAVARAQRRGGRVAVVFVDLDRFKSVNDSLGHAAGDRVLEEVAGRLLAAVRAPDTVARLGGDEFGLLLEDITGVSDAEEVAERIAETFRAPLRIRDQDVHLAASIGIAMIPDEAVAGKFGDPDEYIRRADTAMYRAKEEPGTRHRVFDPSLDSEEYTWVQQESDLRQALERQEFVLHYQPVMAAATEEVVAVEPLLRWEHGERGLLFPVHFLGLAQETGLIRDLSQWVLEESCSRAAEWNRSLPGDRTIRVQPNISATELGDPGYLERLERALDKSGLQPELLMLEVTEHTAMKSTQRIGAIQDLGVGVAVDDFGTGYSSLAYIKQLRANALKVDRSFVAGLPDQATDRAIVSTIITLAHSLDMEVIGEGVETQAQLEWLRESDCDSVQGFVLGRGVPAEELARSLELTMEADPRT